MKVKDIIEIIEGEVVGISSMTGKVLFNSNNNKDSIQKFLCRDVYSINTSIKLSTYAYKKCVEPFIELHIEDFII